MASRIAVDTGSDTDHRQLAARRKRPPLAENRRGTVGLTLTPTRPSGADRQYTGSADTGTVPEQVEQRARERARPQAESAFRPPTLAADLSARCRYPGEGYFVAACCPSFFYLDRS